MNQSNNKRNIVLIIMHLMLGVVLFNYPFLSTYWGFSIVIIASYYILSYPDNSSILPLKFSAYIIGLEVLLRMCQSSLFWEFGKYAVIYFIFLGILRKKSKIRIYVPISIYFLFLLPSIIHLPLGSLSLWRQDVAFNLAGPACLTILSIYLYNINLKRTELFNILFYVILPILSMSVVIILKMPDITSYSFAPHSNPLTSGGYGPNQVSTIYGFMVASLLLGWIMKINITGSKMIDLISLIIFIGLGLITFSRGGLFSAIIAIVLAFSFYFIKDQRKIQVIFKIGLILILTSITWFAIVNITEGAISKRYGIAGGAYGERFVVDLTGRVRIYEIDINIFSDNFLTGVGPGQAHLLRERYGYGKVVAAHTEFSRMLAEHGLLGLFSLSLLIGIPIYYFTSNESPKSKLIKIVFGTLALLTMLHSAMRIAMPCFAYGLLFPKYYDE